MIETLSKQRPYRVSFDKLFPVINQGIWEADLDLIKKVSDIYFSRKVVIIIDRTKKNLKEERITLEDHGVPFDKIIRKSHKKFSRKIFFAS